ncbi:MAG: hypothetical protein E6I82_00440 [Chloroflexi bacterium]|nr:MAG: hypothetical protein E6I82_00440 [Chloroflexota bacterium]
MPGPRFGGGGRVGCGPRQGAGAPDIFLEACRRIGLPPATCLVVEDAVSGVTAAKAAGARCLALTTTFEAAQLAHADWIAPDLAHAPAEALAW